MFAFEVILSLSVDPDELHDRGRRLQDHEQVQEVALRPSGSVPQATQGTETIKLFSSQLKDGADVIN